MWLVFTIMSIISRGLYGMLSKILSDVNQISAMTQIVLFMISCTIWLIILAPFINGFNWQFEPQIWIYIIIAILSFSIGNIFYYFGITKLESATTQIVFSSIVLWNALLAIIVLHTKFTIIQIIGIVILLIALLMAQYQNKKLHLTQHAFFIFASAACFAGFQVITAKVAKEIATATYLLFIYIGNILIIGIPYRKTILSDIKKRHLIKTKKFALLISTIGLFSTLYTIFSYLAYRSTSNPGIVVMLLTLQVIIGVLLSIIFLNERKYIPLKITAAIFSVIAAIMIKT